MRGSELDRCHDAVYVASDDMCRAQGIGFCSTERHRGGVARRPCSRSRVRRVTSLGSGVRQTCTVTKNALSAELARGIQNLVASPSCSSRHTTGHECRVCRVWTGESSGATVARSEKTFLPSMIWPQTCIRPSAAQVRRRGSSMLPVRDQCMDCLMAEAH